tara:strand:- start:4345 stop:5214 length:870 start_codon:yes stop_codon:yes gene_type:complete
MEGYLIHFAVLIAIYSILTLSLQLSIGFAGLLNLGHIAFYAIGGYSSSLLSLQGIDFLSSILVAGFVSSFFACCLSFPTSKLKGDYFAVATMGFSFVVYEISLNWISLTKGPMGLTGIPRPVILGFVFNQNVHFLFLSIIFLIFCYMSLSLIVRSSFGRVVQSVRDDELAAKVLGKNTNKVKRIVLSVSAFFAGLAGGLYSHYINYIDPDSFTVMELIPVLCIVIIGGLGSLKGTLISTVILVLLPEPLRFIGFSSDVIGPARQILYAVLLILILIYRPKGFYGRFGLK